MEATERKCIRCKQQKKLDNFPISNSKFMPAHKSLICTDCLELMVKQDELQDVDKLFQYLDIPFFVDKWTKLFKTYGEHTLTAYLALLAATPQEYEGLDWTDTNTRWHEAMVTQTMDENIEDIQLGRLAQLKRDWPGAVDRTDQDYVYLQDLFDGILKTQNVTTAIQHAQARQFCEAMLNATKKIRAGGDAKDEMKVCHDIMKANGFEPKNAKNIGDFDSVGEIFAWLEKRGWNPEWAHPQNDEIDLMMKNTQQYLKRLVMGAGNLTEQVENRKRAFEVSQALENETDETNYKKYEEATIENELEYEDEGALIKDIDAAENGEEEL